MGFLEDMDKELKNAFQDIKGRVEKADIDKTMKEVGDKISSEANYAGKKLDETIKKTEIDKKVNQAGDSFASAGKSMSDELDKMIYKKSDTTEGDK